MSKQKNRTVFYWVLFVVVVVIIVSISLVLVEQRGNSPSPQSSPSLPPTPTTFAVKNFQSYTNKSLPPAFPAGFPVLAAPKQVLESESMLSSEPSSGNSVAIWTNQSIFQFETSSSTGAIFDAYQSYFNQNKWTLLPQQSTKSPSLLARNASEFISISLDNAIVTVTISQPQQ